ncbi:hypothetical protein RJ640_013293 [Escallonia rubra]|uniref:Uncharacterized protein n=1 Tax=Escallonia rubra TaxID=112253 RepID=A0AA88R6W7_9ASTE|nr:hypothetical protein RJ640_013293 [Escallonia rubra]
MGEEQAEATTLMCDNKSAIAMTKNPGNHCRTKHINIKYHFVREAGEDGEVQFQFCKAEDQVADVFTKAIPKERLDYFRLKLASEAINGHATSSMAIHTVNLRRRLEPPLPNHCMGNLVSTATAVHDPSETEVELAELVETLREKLSNFDSESVNALKGDEGLALISSMVEEMRNLQHGKVKMNKYRFTSWCNMGLYNMDFGWGKPVWVSHMGDPEDKRSQQAVIFIERGDGIEARMFSDEKEVCVLEKDPEFLAYACPNQSIRI